jgi:hypothetical protein
MYRYSVAGEAGMMLHCLRSRRSDDPDDGAEGDHFRSGGAGAGVGDGAASGLRSRISDDPNNGAGALGGHVPGIGSEVVRRLAGRCGLGFVGHAGIVVTW